MYVCNRRTGKGEVCPEGYELIDRTPMDHDADLNHGSMSSWGLRRAVHLAVRRQHVSKRYEVCVCFHVWILFCFRFCLSKGTCNLQ